MTLDRRQWLAASAATATLATFGIAPRATAGNWQIRRNQPGIFALGRLKPGVTLEESDVRTWLRQQVAGTYARQLDAAGRRVGLGYLEMTGYAARLRL